MNPRAGFPTYTLSRGASSAYLSTSPNKIIKLEERAGFEPADARTSLVFKTSSLNRSDISPKLSFAIDEKYYIISLTVCQYLF